MSARRIQPRVCSLLAVALVAFGTVALVAFGTAEPAFASEEAHAGGGLQELLLHFLNLAIVVGALVYFAGKPIRDFFEARRSQIQTELKDAAELLAQAEARYGEWQRKLIDLERDSQVIRNEGRRHAEEEAATILAEAQAAAERIQSDAEAAVEHELRRAQAELRREAAELATEMAERILRERLVETDRERLMDEFITRVEPQAS